MVRNYVKKRRKPYSDGQLQKAVERVENGETLCAVSKSTHIPYETLRRNSIYKMKKVGSPRVLSDHEEILLVQLTCELSERGFPLDRKDLQNLVKSYLDYKGEDTKFVNNKPGKEWLRAFEKRHSELCKRKPELPTKACAEGLSTYVINEFFDMYKKNPGGKQFNWKPKPNFNLDETGLNTDPRTERVYCKKSSKNAHLRSASCGKATYSVLFCCSATGNFLPPFVVYKSKFLYDTWTVGGPCGAMYGCTESGWMQDRIFESWLERFALYVEPLEKPCLLIMDGHGSHITYRCAQICRENEIILLCLPPHTSHALQPLDVGVFAPLKKIWKETIKAWSKESRLQVVSKAVFPTLLGKLVAKMEGNWATGGFRGSGLYPINPEVVRLRAVDSAESIAESQLVKEVDLMRRAVVSVVAPIASPETSSAVQNNKKRRKRVQAKIGEVLTSSETMERLKEEEVERKKKLAEKKKGEKKVERSEKVQRSKKKCPNKRVARIEDSSDSDDSIEIRLDDTDLDITDDSQSDEEGPCTSRAMAADQKQTGHILTVSKKDLVILDWVVVQYGERKFLRQIEKILLGFCYQINFARFQPQKAPTGRVFVFPVNRDVENISFQEIVGRVEPPTPTRRGELIFDIDANMW